MSSKKPSSPLPLMEQQLPEVRSKRYQLSENDQIYDDSDEQEYFEYAVEEDQDQQHKDSNSPQYNPHSSSYSNGLSLGSVQQIAEQEKRLLLEELEQSDGNPSLFPAPRSRVIADREDEYHARRRLRTLSPERADPFSKSSDTTIRTYADIIKESDLNREQADLQRQLSKAPSTTTTKRDWEMSTPDQKSSAASSSWEEDDHHNHENKDPFSTPKRRRWDQQTPLTTTPNWEATPQRTPTRTRSRWDETPLTTTTDKSSTTPMSMTSIGMASTPIHFSPYESTPLHPTKPSPDMEMDIRNAPLSDLDLDVILPSEGYVILDVPKTYAPIRTPSRKLTSTPTPYHNNEEYRIPAELSLHLPPEFRLSQHQQEGVSDLPALKPEDYQYFGDLVDSNSRPDSSLSIDEIKERKVMRLLLKLKNGTPAQRKVALRQMSQSAREFGPALLFDKLLPLLMSPSLEDQERHLLVKLVDRILYRLDEAVRPYVHKILVVIEPLLIDQDYTTRVEGREIISNLSKAAGLATMISAMRPDIDHSDEYVRNTTARALSVVASALGIPTMMPFLKAVCSSKKSWTARHTGVKVVQQIAVLVGCGILPHLHAMVGCVQDGLGDEHQKVRTMTALSLAALAEASAPYGIEAFEGVLKPLWKGIRQHRGKALAAFLKAIGCLIPLMDAEYASYYTREVMVVLVREFATPDDDMKKIVLLVVKQCAETQGVTADFLRSDVLPPFFTHFWVRRMALDRRNYRQLVDTTVELAKKVGPLSIITRIIGGMKDESEPFRKMVIETMEIIIKKEGSSHLDDRLAEQIIDGLLFSFQEQLVEDAAILEAFSTILSSLGIRSKGFLPQICSTLLWRLNNKSAKVRQQAADLVGKIAPVMVVCREEKLLAHLGLVLFEYLGEEYPEVLGSILGGLRGVVSVIGMTKMNPPIKDLLPRLTPILKNRHEKVQENCIELVGRIADRAPESVSPREWMRICFELLEILKAHRKSIRRAAVNTFGYIAKAIGPQDVLTTLLSNLKVQERQNRVYTTVAIAIVAECCSPFTVLPALMNEYRVPELNVQNGVLKSLSFLFEYIGEMGRDYSYAVVPLLEDALMDRDAVHRQIASSAVKHMALGVMGFGCEDGLIHLANFIWPNILEESPHVIMAVMEAIEALRWAVGPIPIFLYVITCLFHPARRLRKVAWNIYNMLLVTGQDALVPVYPSIHSLDSGVYARHELEMVL